MEQQALLTEKKEGICTITLNRPERRNALSPDLLISMVQQLRALAEDKSIRVIVLRGTGQQAFSSGYDITNLPDVSRLEEIGIKVSTPEESTSTLLSAVEDLVTEHRCPIIAMIYGFCIGAGLDLAASCDLRIASESAEFAMPPARLGNLYHFGGIAKFVRLAGTAATSELFLTGARVNADRAREMGLVNMVVPEEQLEKTVYDMAGQICENAPLAVSGIKAMVRRLGKYPPLDPKDEDEFRAMVQKVRSSEDYQEGRKAFKEKRKPQFQGR